MTHDNGGPAFPGMKAERVAGERILVPVLGMTLHDYFMAHAPAEPQRWFKPLLSSPKPQIDLETGLEWSEKDWPNDIRRWYLGGLDDTAETLTKKYPGCSNLIKELKEHMRAISAWYEYCEREHYIQWPAAWADAMIAEKRRIEEERRTP